MNVYFINSSLPFFYATEIQRSSNEQSICFLCPTVSCFTDSEIKYAKKIYEIIIEKGKKFNLYPDFPTQGVMDVSNYNDGLRGGRIKIRARISQINMDPW